MDSTTFICPATQLGCNYNSFSDWQLMKTVPTKITEPSIKELFVDIPGSDGSVDLSEALTGAVAYQDRSYQDTFLFFGNRKMWKHIINEIRKVLDGRLFEIEIDELKGWVYIGRPMITDVKEDEHGRMTITVGCKIQPYRFEKYYSDDTDWLWDDFNFEDGIIRGYNGLEVTDTLTLNIYSRKQKVCPYFNVQNAGGLSITFGGKSYPLQFSGYIDDIILIEGSNVLIFENTGGTTATLRIRFRAGDL